MLTKIHRRLFFKKIIYLFSSVLLSGLIVNKIFRNAVKTFKGEIKGGNFRIGHLLRFGKFKQNSVATEVDTIIVGGGVAGLSAAWWLKKNNFNNFQILELDNDTGGNSRSGSNTVSKYPWGAHYLPLPGEDANYVRMLLKDLNIIIGEENGLPLYNEFDLCSDPEDRLFFKGTWQPGLIPNKGLSENEKKDFLDFFEEVNKYKSLRGKDGKRAFTIPLDLSSRDEELILLDKISMKDWINSKGWTASPLIWYVNYCCRDDYGQSYSDVSAWAGLHYFCSRNIYCANTDVDSDTVLTWPEGNGRIVNELKRQFSSQIKTNALVYNVQEDQSTSSIFVDFYDSKTNLTYRYKAKNVIYAGPRFTAKFVIKSNLDQFINPDLSYVPWLVANVTLTTPPRSERGEPLAWDNVSYYGESLGYIYANHQDINAIKKQSVITYYHPLSDKSPKQSRIEAAGRDYSYWSKLVTDDLEKLHPGISQQILELDVWIWGHGLVSPGINYIWGDQRQKMLKSLGNIHFAHSDMSGISIFEEANYRGVLAANKVLGRNR